MNHVPGVNCFTIACMQVPWLPDVLVSFALREPLAAWHAGLGVTIMLVVYIKLKGRIFIFQPCQSSVSKRWSFA